MSKFQQNVNIFFGIIFCTLILLYVVISYIGPKIVAKGYTDGYQARIDYEHSK